MGLALVHPEQSLEGALGSAAVWSHPCVLGWAGHLSPAQATTASPVPCLEHPAWSSWDKLQWVPCALGAWTSLGLGARGEHPATLLCQSRGTETS